MKFLKSLLVLLLLSVILPSSTSANKFRGSDDSDYMNDGSGEGELETTTMDNYEDYFLPLLITTFAPLDDISTSKTDTDLYIDNNNNGESTTEDYGLAENNRKNRIMYIDDPMPTNFYSTSRFLVISISISMVIALLFGVFIVYVIVNRKHGHSHDSRQQKTTSDKNCNVKNLNDVHV